MGYDISLVDSFGNPVSVDSHEEGGCTLVGGNREARISITYNYSEYFYELIDTEIGIRWLYDRQAYECFHRLREAVRILGTYRDDNYWQSTPGNAGHILSVLLKWADANPNARFTGD